MASIPTQSLLANLRIRNTLLLFRLQVDWQTMSIASIPTQSLLENL